MRKIISKQEENKKSKRNKIILGLVLIFILFFSVAEYSFFGFNNNEETNQNNKKINYNDFEFSEQNGFWLLNKNGNSFIFSYNPSEVERINFNVNHLENYYEKNLYINSEDIESESELRANLGQFVKNIQIQKNETCEDNIIVIKGGIENKIYQDKNCVFIEGKNEELIKLTDLFLFKILGIEK